MTSTLDDRAPMQSGGEPAPTDPATGSGRESLDARHPLEAGATAVPRPTIRTAIAVALPTIGTAVLVGGSFTGPSARIYASIGAALGIALGALVARLRRPGAAFAAIALGLFAIGLVTLAPAGLDAFTHLRAVVGEAVAVAKVQRPPVPLTPGWQALLGWLLGMLGFVVAWLALSVGRPPAALLLPLPIAGIAGISLPHEQQVPMGILVLVLFGAALGILSSAGRAGDDDNAPSAAFQARRALRAVPLLAAITVGSVLLSQASFLFPKPLINPADEPQKPKTTPLSEVKDRVLFKVDAAISGPWRIGSLDVYDGKDWRTAPFAEANVRTVPRSGIVDADLKPASKATFTIAGLEGAVLPGLPNIEGISAAGPRLAYDARTGSVRVENGQIKPGMTYTVVAGPTPNVEDVKNAGDQLPPNIVRFTHIQPAPASVAALIAKAPRTSKWEAFDFLRSWILDNVTVSGTGVPVEVTPSRVAAMVRGEGEATPYEIVAAQAMMARWVGVPSRIGYGFDGGDVVGDTLEVRPKHGATFVEVYFPGFKWIPVIGTPKKAKPTVGADPGQQRTDPAILPSDDISVRVFLPIVLPPRSLVLQRTRTAVLISAAILLLLATIYLILPLLQKAMLRNRRRTAAAHAGARARVTVAYADWRDFATDMGYGQPTQTPIEFYGGFVRDEEHSELAWLVTRVLWGDLHDSVSDREATTAEQLSFSLQRRLASTQPVTVRAVAKLSRLSLRYPYPVDLSPAPPTIVATTPIATTTVAEPNERVYEDA